MYNILVAEDSATQALKIRRLLEDAEFEVRVASNGREALKAVVEQPPTALLTDLDMPEMNGLELVDVIRREHPSVPVILMTAYGSEEIAVRALQMGAASYVPKKSLTEELVSTLRDVIEVAQATREETRLAEFMTTLQLEFAISRPSQMATGVVAEIQDALADMAVADNVTRIRLGVALESAIKNLHYLGNLELSPEWLERAYSDDDDGQQFARSVEARAAEPQFGDRGMVVRAEIQRDTLRVALAHSGPPLSVDNWVRASNWQGLAGHSAPSWVLAQAFLNEIRLEEDGRTVRLLGNFA
jgi:CheY-like chemotaxis protein